MQSKPSVVICGSFRRDITGLKKLFLELETNGCRVLAPITLDFTDQSSDYVRLQSEYELSVVELEKFYLRAIAQCDFVWLHAPEGYVGVSGAFELGFAHSKGKAIYAHKTPNDLMLQSFVTRVGSVFEAIYSSTVLG